MSKAKKIPEYLNDAVIYQIFPRMFTPRGTLKSAEKMLPHIKSLGADIVYLCPTFVQDEDTDHAFWSTGQQILGYENPKNPYRIADYYHVDEEYGTDDDLRDFVRTAHALGLRVMFDLVYFHCGPTAVFLKEHPDFVYRNEDGTAKCGVWHFPQLNFDNPELREYLWDNMVYLIREFDCDGFRTDVSDRVPLDFWVEARRRCEALKPDLVMLNEGRRKEDQEAAYDINYYFADNERPGRGCLARTILSGFDVPYFLRVYRQYMDEYITDGGLTLLNYDNHDYASGKDENRMETLMPAGGMEAVWFWMFTMRGVPFIYNGCEVADTRQHCIYANRFHSASLGIEWENALAERGASRLALARDLIALRKATPALSCRGSIDFLPCDNPWILAYVRTYGNEKYLAVINIHAEAENATLPGENPGETVRGRGLQLTAEGGRLSVHADGFGFALVKWA